MEYLLFAHPESLILKDQNHVQKAIRKAKSAATSLSRYCVICDTGSLEETLILDDIPDLTTMKLSQICVLCREDDPAVRLEPKIFWKEIPTVPLPDSFAEDAKRYWEKES